MFEITETEIEAQATQNYMSASALAAYQYWNVAKVFIQIRQCILLCSLAPKELHKYKHLPTTEFEQAAPALFQQLLIKNMTEDLKFKKKSHKHPWFPTLSFPGEQWRFLVFQSSRSRYLENTVCGSWASSEDVMLPFLFIFLLKKKKAGLWMT